MRRMRRLYDDNLALYGKRYYYYVWELPVFVLMGVTAGLLGSLFIKLNILMTQLRARFIPPSKPRLRLMEVPAAFACPANFLCALYTCLQGVLTLMTVGGTQGARQRGKSRP